MIDFGKYKVHVDNMFYTGDAVFELEKDGDKYEFELEVFDTDFEIKDIVIFDVIEDGNNITAKAEVPILKGKPIDVNLTFENGKCNGFLKIPFVGKIKIKDAVKID